MNSFTKEVNKSSRVTKFYWIHLVQFFNFKIYRVHWFSEGSIVVLFMPKSDDGVFKKICLYFGCDGIQISCDSAVPDTIGIVWQICFLTPVDAEMPHPMAAANMDAEYQNSLFLC